ncbi:MAG: hypothetical protein JXB88_07395 [Spirochaetales bacterium]|nr:hypothetical protein [Spirochaetales bacterium]
MYTKTTFYLLIVFIIFFPSYAYSLDMIEDLLPQEENYTALFPRTFLMKGLAFTNNCEISGPIEIIINNNPETEQFEFIFTSPLSKAELIIDKHLNAKSSKTSFVKTFPELIKKAGHDKRVYSREKNGKKPESIVLTHFLAKKEKKKKSFSCDRNTFPSDTVMFILQILLLKGIKKNFLLDIISLEDALKVRMNMTYYFTDNVLALSKNFPFPRGIEEAVRPDELYHVFKMKLHGLAGLFIQTSWFFVFKAEYPFSFIIYWGGEGKTAEVFYFLENKYTVK